MPSASRGEVWQIDLGMVAKVRPALILNIPFQDHERAVYAIVPHTTSVRGTRFEALVQVRGLASGAFDAQGLRQVPGTVLLRRLHVLSATQIAEVERVTRLWLGL